MKIKFIKDHNKYAKGDIADVSPERAKYWVMVKAAEYTEGEAAKAPAKPKAPVKPKAATKPIGKKESKPGAKRTTKELKTKPITK